MVVLFGLCFGVIFCAVCTLYVFAHFSKVLVTNLAAHLAYDLFFLV